MYFVPKCLHLLILLDELTGIYSIILSIIYIYTHICVCVCVFFFLFRATPVAHGSSQVGVRGRIIAAAAGLYHSHNIVGSESCL